MEGRVKPGIELRISYFDTMLNYRLSQKVKLLGNDEFNHLTINLTTLTLAFYMKRMMVDQVMVQKLSTCNTMGFATTICNDKTRTPMLNQMKVTKFWLGKVSFAPNAHQFQWWSHVGAEGGLGPLKFF